MRKGSFHISVILALIIAAIILVIFAPMLIKSAYAVWEQIARALGLIQPSGLEDAIKCSYYRCINGCSDPSTNEICGKVDPDACNLPTARGLVNIFTRDGNKYKVCGWQAAQFPVEVDGEKASSVKAIGKDIGDIHFDCIIPGDAKELGFNQLKIAEIAGGSLLAGGSTILCIGALTTAAFTGGTSLALCGIAAGSIAWLALTGTENWNHLLILDASIISSRKTTTCENSGFNVGTIEDAIESFTVNTDRKLYVYTDWAEEWFGPIKYGDKKLTTVITIPPYIVIPEKNKEYVFNFSKGATDMWYRINIKPVRKDFALNIKDLGETYVTLNLTDGSSSVSKTLYINGDMCLPSSGGALDVKVRKFYVYEYNNITVELGLNYSSTCPSSSPPATTTTTTLPPSTEYLPTNYPTSDTWTESTDNWEGGVWVDNDNVKKGSVGIKFYSWGCLNLESALGDKLDINKWNKIHFWLKPSDTKFYVKFRKDECTSGPGLICEFDVTPGEWNEITLDIHDESVCKPSEATSLIPAYNWEPVMGIQFSEVGTGNYHYIDDLYLCKNC